MAALLIFMVLVVLTFILFIELGNIRIELKYRNTLLDRQNDILKEQNKILNCK